MAKTKSPLHSLDAWGTLGGTLIYRRAAGGGRVHARSRAVRVAGDRAPSAAQSQQRNAYADAVASWHAATPEERLALAPLAKRRKISLFNAWISNALLTQKKYQYWRVWSEHHNPLENGISCSELQLLVDGTPYSLAAATITSLQGTFHPSYPLARINDNIIETVNGVNIAYKDGDNFDIGITLTEAVRATAIRWAPQGDINSMTFNNPIELRIYTSPDGTVWTLTAEYTGISTGIGPWNPGTFREFATGI